MSDSLVAPEYLSPSSISTFQQCPLKFKLSRIDRLMEPPTEATIRGNFVHDVLEALYNLKPTERTVQAARDLSRSLWDIKWADEIGQLITDPVKVKEFRWSSWWCIQNLWDLEDPQQIVPTGLEYEISVAVGGVQVRGFIDRYSQAPDGLIVSDYKTGKKPHPRYQGDKFFQLLVYAAALRELGLPQVSTVELLFLKESARLTKKVSADDLAETTSTIVSVRSGIDARCAAGQFEPIPNKLCDWCHFKPICPAWKGAK